MPKSNLNARVKKHMALAAPDRRSAGRQRLNAKLCREWLLALRFYCVGVSNAQMSLSKDKRAASGGNGLALLGKAGSAGSNFMLASIEQSSESVFDDDMKASLSNLKEKLRVRNFKAASQIAAELSDSIPV